MFTLILIFCFNAVAHDARVDSSPIEKWSSFSADLNSPGKLYRGARPQSEADFRWLTSQGIKTVISLQGGDLESKLFGKIIPYWEKGETEAERAQQRAWAKKYGIDLIELPVNSLDEIDYKNQRNIFAAMQVLHQIESGEEVTSVLIHCAHGADRTGLVVALYRVLYQNWTADNAYAEWRRKGHTIINMITTWHLDQFFFQYMQFSNHQVTVSNNCEYNLSL